MTEDEKVFAVFGADDFIESVAVMLGRSESQRTAIIRRFPKPTGLGTDGTCWSVEEHRKYYLAVALKAVELLRKSAS